MNGVSRSLVSAVTTPPNAAPITTPTAISTTFPRRMNFLKPSSIGTSFDQEERVACTRGIVNSAGDRNCQLRFVILSEAKNLCNGLQRRGCGQVAQVLPSAKNAALRMTVF